LVADARWRTKLLRTVEVNYAPSPFFGEVFPLVESIVEFDTTSLSEINKKSVVDICGFLGIETKILTDSHPFDDLEQELRHADGQLSMLFPHVDLDDAQVKVVRALELCRRMDADVFINAIGGRELYDQKDFARNGVALYFIDTHPITYPQRSEQFHPRLSIIDVLMSCGRIGTSLLLHEYDLV
jgi:hypothetical protein